MIIVYIKKRMLDNGYKYHANVDYVFEIEYIHNIDLEEQSS
jgi:hypothetical protein